MDIKAVFAAELKQEGRITGPFKQRRLVAWLEDS
jgi:hypothetical protein